MVELSLAQKIRLRIFGHVSVGTRMKECWSKPHEYFAFNCPKHGLVVDYSHGYKERLDCPICIEETHKYA